MTMPKIKLNSFDELFKADKTEEENQAIANENEETMSIPKKQEPPQLALSCLRKSKNNPFKPYVGDKLNELEESIKEHGILTPILVRPLNDESDTYEIVAGHNRVNAAKIAGLETIPSVIKAMDDDTAAILMVESNFQQRQKILPSEKAFAYKIQLAALKRQGKRTDLTGIDTSAQIEPKFNRTNEIVAEQAGESRAQVQRYIRLTALSPDLLEAVDNNKIPFIPAVNISYLREGEQQALSEIFSEKEIKISLGKSEKLKIESAGRELDRHDILDILEEEKPKTKAVKTIKIPFKAVQEIFTEPELTETEMRNILIEALKLFYAKRREGYGEIPESETDSGKEAIG